MKTRVSVIMGGPSAEHDISLQTGLEVLKNLDRTKYSISAVVISKNLDFYYGHISKVIPGLNDLRFPQNSKLFRGPIKAYSSRKIWEQYNVAFMALHGSFGEDGVFQGFLDTIGIAYTGSGVYASAVAMNKIASKIIFASSGLSVPSWSIFGPSHTQTTIKTISERHGFPCFVKCPHGGSSRLMGKANNETELKNLLKHLAKESEELLVETAIKGIEFSCGVIERPNGLLEALPPIEIRPKNSDFFDFKAKYSNNASEEIVPAPRSVKLLEKIKNVALKAHQCIGCSGISRTDMIWNGKRLFVLEINSLPGLTSHSLLPKAFKAQGGTYGELLDLLIETALSKKRKKIS